MLLIELAAILVAAKLSGDLATRWGQPPVLGQLVAGLGLGLGYAMLRPGEALPASTELSAFAQIGVVLLMFRAGLETDWPQLRSVGRAAAFALAAVAQVSGLGGIPGAFVAGLLLNREGGFEPVADKVRLVGDAVFVPIFLVKTGMDARVEQLGAVALLVGVLIAVAIVTKIIGCGVAARAPG